MDYQLKPCAGQWSSVFAVPTALVDEHLKLAGATQLKTLLWLLRHNGAPHTVEEIACGVGYGNGDTLDALRYWVTAGLLEASGDDAPDAALQPPSPPAPVKKEKEPSPPAPAVSKRQVAPIPIASPTSADVVRRGNECPELAFLLQEAQMKLGRTISLGEQAMLLNMHDHYGLPVEVILMLLEYAVSQGKTNTSYLLKIAKNWAEDGVDSLENAEMRISSLRNSATLWNALRKATGLEHPRPTPKQAEFLHTWSEKWGFSLDMILKAFEEMQNHTEKTSFPYVNKVLENWHSKGIKTPEEADNQTPPAEKGGRRNPPASYDLDEFESSSLYEPLVYTKEK